MTATNQTARPPSKAAYRLQKLLIMLLAIIWIAAGAAKLAALTTFQDVLHNHGVLSPRAISAAWLLPALEVVIGVMVLITGGSPRFPRARRVAAVLSSGLLLAFCFYIARVPEDIFRSVGCGCEGVLGLTDLTGAPSRTAAIVINATLAAAGWAVFRPLR